MAVTFIFLNIVFITRRIISFLRFLLFYFLTFTKSSTTNYVFTYVCSMSTAVCKILHGPTLRVAFLVIVLAKYLRCTILYEGYKKFMIHIYKRLLIIKYLCNL